MSGIATNPPLLYRKAGMSGMFGITLTSLITKESWYVWYIAGNPDLPYYTRKLVCLV